jgi:hypothetical protein
MFGVRLRIDTRGWRNYVRSLQDGSRQIRVLSDLYLDDAEQVLKESFQASYERVPAEMGLTFPTEWTGEYAGNIDYVRTGDSIEVTTSDRRAGVLEFGGGVPPKSVFVDWAVERLGVDRSPDAFAIWNSLYGPNSSGQGTRPRHLFAEVFTAPGPRREQLVRDLAVAGQFAWKQFLTKLTRSG